jgi:hypothetical protein
LSSSRAVSLDGVFILDRINAKEIIPEFPQYDFPRIDTADCKENGKWFKRYLTFKTVKVNNIDVQYSNEELNGIIEVKIWRCKFIREKSKEPDNPPEIGVNNISHHNNTQNSIFVACLGPKKKFTAPRSSKASKSKITDKTYHVAYIDDEDKPYAAFKFQYRSNGMLVLSSGVHLTNRFPEGALAHVEDRASDSFSDLGQVFGGESSYHSPSGHIPESIENMVDDGAMNAVSHTPDKPASALPSDEPDSGREDRISSNTIHNTAGDSSLRCKQGHLLYCSQCATSD